MRFEVPVDSRQPVKTKTDWNQNCDLTNRDANVWLGVNESVLRESGPKGP